MNSKGFSNQEKRSFKINYKLNRNRLILHEILDKLTIRNTTEIFSNDLSSYCLKFKLNHSQDMNNGTSSIYHEKNKHGFLILNREFKGKDFYVID